MSKDRLNRTDLAIEIQEKYEKDNVEISGVVLKETYNKYGTIKTTTVEIINSYGAEKMGRPKGKYITVERVDKAKDMYRLKEIINEFTEQVKSLVCTIANKDTIEKVLVVGLGNADITPDAVGPLVVKDIDVTRHIIKERVYCNKGFRYEISALAPGVMGQTGMEVSELIKSVVKAIGIELVVVIDALAARSVDRLGHTIQLTDTGISPGSGVGNNRAAITKESVGVPVIAIGVPTVVDAYTITFDIVENYLEKEGLSESEIASFTSMIQESSIENMYMTPKNIDELVKGISKVLAKGINNALLA